LLFMTMTSSRCLCFPAAIYSNTYWGKIDLIARKQF
jgi:hypothetical protein